jgi:hypothetical protein
MPSEVVIAVYRPHPGKSAQLEAILRRHVSTLRSLGLATARPVTLLKSADGSYLELFEWASSEAAQAAHDAPAVAALWEEMGTIADFPPLADLSETKRRFAHFSPVDGIVT